MYPESDLKTDTPFNFTAELVVPGVPQERSSEQEKYHRKVGGWQFRLAGAWDLASFDGQDPEGFAIAGNWPHPPSMKLMKLKCQGNDWSLISDYVSLMPIYYRRSDRGSIEAVSTLFSDLLRPDLKINTEAMEECTLLGHTIGTKTLLDRIEKAPMGMRIDCIDGVIKLVRDSRTDPLQIPPDAESILHPVEHLARHSSPLFLELTGGLDSRLSLAILLNSGVKPTCAMTIGRLNSPDVRVARSIAEAVGMDHRVIDESNSVPPVHRAGDRFITASGGIANYSQYYPLAALTSELDGDRMSQASGLGGEFGIDFYWAPGIDSLTSMGFLRPLTRHRILQISPSLRKSLGAGVLRAANRITDEIMAKFESYQKTPWESLRHFYIHERMAHWAFPILDANRQRYELVSPLLSKEYLAWTNSMTRSTRKHRKGQTNLLPKICRGFAEGSSILSLQKSQSSSYVSQATARVRKVASKLLLKRMPDSGEDRHDLLGEFAAARGPAAFPKCQEIHAFDHDLTPENVRSSSQPGDKFAGMFMTASVLLQECRNSG